MPHSEPYKVPDDLDAFYTGDSDSIRKLRDVFRNTTQLVYCYGDTLYLKRSALGANLEAARLIVRALQMRGEIA